MIEIGQLRVFRWKWVPVPEAWNNCPFLVVSKRESLGPVTWTILVEGIRDGGWTTGDLERVSVDLYAKG